jgi:DNA-binding protein H-NS
MYRLLTNPKVLLKGTCNIKELDMSKLEELLEQQAQLSTAIEAAKKQQKTEDLKTVRQLCKAHGFTANMLKGFLAEGRKRRAKS